MNHPIHLEPRVLALLALLMASHASTAQVTLVSRESILSGNYLVGFATLGDSGSDRQIFDSPDLVFAHAVSGAGGVNGFFGDTPVVGDGSFASSQRADAGPLQFTLEGTASTSLSTPYSHVSAGANAFSQLDWLINLAEPMNFTLRVQLTEEPGATVNGLTARADALFKLSGPGDAWLFSDPGEVLLSGQLAAGNWRVNTFADTRGNGLAGFQAVMLLSPVPEPATSAMLVLGLAGLMGWRKRRGARAA